MVLTNTTTLNENDIIKNSFPGSNENITHEESTKHLNKVIQQIEVGDYELCTDDD